MIRNSLIIGWQGYAQIVKSLIIFSRIIIKEKYIKRSIYILKEYIVMDAICNYCTKRIIVKMVLSILNIKITDLAKQLHISNGLVSKYLSGECNSKDLDLYFIEQIFGIRVVDYVRNKRNCCPRLDNSRTT